MKTPIRTVHLTTTGAAGAGELGSVRTAVLGGEVTTAQDVTRLLKQK